MPVTIDTYNKIKEKYGNISLWAEHADNRSKLGMGDISFFDKEETLQLLNPNIILVGFNISEKILRIFGNFHPDKSVGQDYKTKHYTEYYKLSAMKALSSISCRS